MSKKIFGPLRLIQLTVS